MLHRRRAVGEGLSQRDQHLADRSAALGSLMSINDLLEGEYSTDAVLEPALAQGRVDVCDSLPTGSIRKAVALHDAEVQPFWSDLIIGEIELTDARRRVRGDRGIRAHHSQVEVQVLSKINLDDAVDPPSAIGVKDQARGIRIAIVDGPVSTKIQGRLPLLSAGAGCDHRGTASESELDCVSADSASTAVDQNRLTLDGPVCKDRPVGRTGWDAQACSDVKAGRLRQRHSVIGPDHTMIRCCSLPIGFSVPEPNALADTGARYTVADLNDDPCPIGVEDHRWGVRLIAGPPGTALRVRWIDPGPVDLDQHLSGAWPRNRASAEADHCPCRAYL